MQLRYFLVRVLRTPEAQFFIIFAIPFAGFFIVNDTSLREEYQFIARVLLGGSAVIVLLQTLYSITAHWRAEEEEQGFLAATAHHLRTPLTAIRWTLQEFSKRELSADERLELAKISSAAAQKLSNVVDSFDQLTRLSADRLAYLFEEVELAALVAKTATDSELVARQHGVTITLEVPREGVTIDADAVKLEVAIANLIHNAIMYNRRGGMVTVRVRRLQADHRVELVVADTGIGLAPADQKNIFTKYFRTDAAKTMSPEGTGLGLFLVKSIVERHRGVIWVESVLGKGTAVHCSFPEKA